MFSDQLIDVARRKERLIARAEQQRAAIAVNGLVWQKPFEAADQVISFARFLKEHPLILGVGVAVAAIIGRVNLLRWGGRGLIAWRAWRSVNAWARKAGV